MRFWIKLAFVFAMTLAILVPLALIDGVIDDRQRNRAEAVEQISGTFAAAQVFGGPVLVIPYTESVEVDAAHADGGPRKMRRDEQRQWIFFPDTVEVGGPIKPSTRRLGLHAVRVYEWAGRADAPERWPRLRRAVSAMKIALRAIGESCPPTSMMMKLCRIRAMRSFSSSSLSDSLLKKISPTSKCLFSFSPSPQFLSQPLR